MAALFMLSAAVLLGFLLPSSMADNILYGGDVLPTGQALIEGNYRFILEPNCNLVLYDRGRNVWNSRTNGRGSNCVLHMHTNGNLAIYNQVNRMVWESKTGGSRGNYVLILQHNRNVVIYGCPRWATGTNTANSEGVVIVKSGLNDTSLLLPSSMFENVLYGGDRLSTGQSLIQGNYRFVMQYDCNLVLYDSGRDVWATGTSGRGYNCVLRMQTDGNLIIYNDNNTAVWASNSKGSLGDYVLVLRRDRNVVIYGCPRWSTGTANVNSEPVVIVKSSLDDTSLTPEVVLPASDEPTNRKIAMVTNN